MKHVCQFWHIIWSSPLLITYTYLSICGKYLKKKKPPKTIKMPKIKISLCAWRNLPEVWLWAGWEERWSKPRGDRRMEPFSRTTQVIKVCTCILWKTLLKKTVLHVCARKGQATWFCSLWEMWHLQQQSLSTKHRKYEGQIWNELGKKQEPLSSQTTRNHSNFINSIITINQGVFMDLKLYSLTMATKNMALGRGCMSWFG